MHIELLKIEAMETIGKEVEAIFENAAGVGSLGRELLRVDQMVEAMAGRFDLDKTILSRIVFEMYIDARMGRLIA